jgi:SNF2 family DNA or RNA helicase
MECHAEIGKTRAGDRIEVTFDYSPEAVTAIKGVPGARFVAPKDGGPMWRLPLDLTSGRILREQFGDGLKLGPKLTKWGHTAVRKEVNLTRLGAADDAELEVLPKVLPELAKWFRPYQRADVAFLALADAINANQPGLGKTSEVIGAVFEAEMDNGAQLVITPKTSIESVWVEELTRWQPHPVIYTSGDDSKKHRQEMIDMAFELAGTGDPFWFVTNPHTVRMERDRTAEMVTEKGKLHYPLIPIYGELFNIPWRTLVCDEYHKAGLTNPNSVMYRSLQELEYEKLLLMSGTPMGGQPLKLFAALQMLDPGRFTSKWRWAGEWLEIKDEEYEKEGEAHVSQVIEGIRPERLEQFYKEHAPYLLRRTKAEVLTQLPPKQRQVIMCDMTPKQRKQYESIAAEAEIKIETENLSVTGVLAEYTRLKQFSDAAHTIKHMASGELKLIPTDECGKLPYLLDLLAERGITGNKEEEGDEQVTVFSQYSGIVNMLETALNSKGINTAKITGDVNRKGERTRLVEEFQAEGGPRVMLMTTGAGGVSINLDRASTVIFIDETWDPDDQEQAEDRCHRASRMHQVNVYYLRSRNSLEEYIARITGGKRLTNRQILDLHRLMSKNTTSTEVANA